MPFPEQSPRRLEWYLVRNLGGFLLGMTWVHHSEWPVRHVHFYLGWWVWTWQWRSRQEVPRE